MLQRWKDNLERVKYILKTAESLGCSVLMINLILLLWDYFLVNRLSGWHMLYCRIICIRLWCSISRYLNEGTLVRGNFQFYKYSKGIFSEMINIHTKLFETDYKWYSIWIRKAVCRWPEKVKQWRNFEVNKIQGLSQQEAFPRHISAIGPAGCTLTGLEAVGYHVDCCPCRNILWCLSMYKVS